MRYLILLTIVLLFSCKVKKPTIITNTILDTINIETIRRIQVPVERIITIENPCDSLGLLKDFKRTFKTEKVYITIQSKEGKIEAKINLDSIQEVWVKEYQGKTEVITKIVEVDKPVPFLPKIFWWIIGGFSISLVMNFRKFIPFLKFLPF